MFLSLEWYWWLIIAGAAALSLPIKVKIMKWWSKRQREQKDNPKEKWGGEE